MGIPREMSHAMGWDGTAHIAFPMNDKSSMIMNARMIMNCESSEL